MSTRTQRLNLAYASLSEEQKDYIITQYLDEESDDDLNARFNGVEV